MQPISHQLTGADGLIVLALFTVAVYLAIRGMFHDYEHDQIHRKLPGHCKQEFERLEKEVRDAKIEARITSMIHAGRCPNRACGGYLMDGHCPRCNRDWQ